MADKLILQGIQCRCHVGVPDWERKKLQTISIDLELHLDLGPAAEADDARLGVDYWEVEKQVREWVQKKEFKLIEAMAESIAQMLLGRFKLVQAVQVRVHKRPKVMPKTEEVIAEVFRRRT
ncbi:MAG: dihydroneopterin aldolase [Elusimicrobia bacterium]|nr:dihydroneopterin aldolase [Elusimicrobiota bacterium]